MECFFLVLNGNIVSKVLPKRLQMYKFCFCKEIYKGILGDVQDIY